jgi:AcrR family transcriptional regulator
MTPGDDRTGRRAAAVLLCALDSFNVLVNYPPMPRATAIASDERLRDADRSQATILAAARDEFAAHGLGGARMDRIAERAGLNKRLIYYYFEDKEQLFRAVLEQAYRQIRDEERKLNLLELKPVDAVRRLVEFTWNYYLGHPEFLSLLNSANLHRGRHLESSRHAREMNSPLIEMLAQILERGRKEGSFRGGIDPLQMYVSIAALSYFYLSNSHTLSAIFGRDLLSAKARNERLTHMCDVILSYVLRS